MTAKTTFGSNDLSVYLREVANENPVVVPLQRDNWVAVGNFKIFLLDVILGTSLSTIKVLIGRHRSITDDIVVSGGPVVVQSCYQIPETNLIFDMWIDSGNGGLAIPLVVEKGFGKTIIEDFMKISTNLPNIVLEKVSKAVITKQVEWDESKTSLVGEGCDGEFVFEGCRYTFDEVFESPSSLFLRSGSSDFINNMVEILEVERLLLLSNHKYLEAKSTYEKIESLNNALNLA